jgi:hypothetical protein
MQLIAAPELSLHCIRCPEVIQATDQGLPICQPKVTKCHEQVACHQPGGRSGALLCHLIDEYAFNPL